MKSIFFKLQMLLPAVVMFAACSETNDSFDGIAPELSPISFTTKSTGDDYNWSGKSLSLSDGTTTAIYTYNNSAWSCTNPLEWGESNGAITLDGYIVMSGASHDGVTLGSADDTIDQNTSLSDYDYLYYYNNSVSYTDDLELTLDHVMTKIIVNITVGDSGKDLTSVSIPSPISASCSGGEWLASSDNLLITPYADGSIYTAYVIPTSYGAGAYTLEFTIDGVNVTASYPSAITFTSGKSYTFDLSLSENGEDVTFDGSVNVSDWSVDDEWGSISTAKVWSGAASDTNGTFGGGDGSATSPYSINTPEHLAELAQIVNTNNTTYQYVGEYFEITADFDLNNIPWTPIADITTATMGSAMFSGSIDGGGHTIYNLNLESTESNDCVGLIGDYRTYGTGVLQDITISNSKITTNGQHVGFLVGYLHNKSSIERCRVENSTIDYRSDWSSDGTGGSVGTLVGTAYHSLNYFKGCEVDNVTITARNGNTSTSVGGLIGKTSNESIIIGCSVNATISAQDGSTGGLVGDISYTGNIGENAAKVYGCYVTGSIDKTVNETLGTNAGGITNSCAGTLIGCYSSISVTSGNKGALVSTMNSTSTYPFTTLFSECYTTRSDSGYPIRAHLIDGVDDPDATYNAANSNTLHKVTDISTKIEVMNAALVSAGYSEWQYEVADADSSFPYEIVYTE